MSSLSKPYILTPWYQWIQEWVFSDFRYEYLSKIGTILENTYVGQLGDSFVKCFLKEDKDSNNRLETRRRSDINKLRGRTYKGIKRCYFRIGCLNFLLSQTRMTFVWYKLLMLPAVHVELGGLLNATCRPCLAWWPSWCYLSSMSNLVAFLMQFLETTSFWCRLRVLLFRLQ